MAAIAASPRVPAASMMVRQRRRVRPEPAADGRAPGGFSEHDAAVLRRETQLLRAPPNTVVKGSPTMRGLLAVPPAEAVDRLFLLVASYQLVSALILSGGLGIAFNPIKTETLPEEKRTLADVFNVLAAALVAISMLHTCTLTWAIAGLLGLTRETVHDAVAHGARWFVIQEAQTALEMMMVLTLIILAQWIHSGTHVARIVTAIVAGLALLFTTAFLHWTVQAFPVNQMPWLGPPTSMGMPPGALFGTGSKRAKARRDRVAAVLVDNAERHLGAEACLPAEPDDAEEPEDGGEGGAEEGERQQLQELLEGALAVNSVSDERMESLVVAMLAERLTARSLRAAAEGGATLLFAALEGLGMKRGEMLDIVRCCVATGANG